MEDYNIEDLISDLQGIGFPSVKNILEVGEDDEGNKITKANFKTNYIPQHTEDAKAFALEALKRGLTLNGMSYMILIF